MPNLSEGGELLVHHTMVSAELHSPQGADQAYSAAEACGLDVDHLEKVHRYRAVDEARERGENTRLEGCR